MLYPYQRAGAQRLAARTAATRHAGLLADGMGLGKSAQAVGAGDVLGRDRITVVCPAIMVDEWRETFLRFGDLPRLVNVVGSKPMPDRIEGAWIVSYERASRPDVAGRLAARCGLVVFDESHYLKEPDAKRTVCLLFGELAARAERLIFLTGTPVPNHAGELWPILYASGLFRGDYAAFLNRYCVTKQTDYGFQVIAHRNVEELRRLLGDMMLRRTHQVVLPPTTYDDWRIDPGECVNALQNIPQRDAMWIRNVIAAGGTDRSHKEIATVRRLIGTAKAYPIAQRVARVLQADRSNKAVVFCLHTDAIAILARELAAYGVVILSGDTPERHRHSNVAVFQSDASKRVAVCQTKAAGVGVTLTAANHLVVAERPWSPADEEQAIYRVIRIGQTRPTFVHRATLTGSVDEAVDMVLARKRRLIAEIVNST